MPLDTRQQKWLPLGLNTQACVQDTATVSSRPGIPFLELGEVYAAEHQFRYLQLPFQALLSGYDQQSCGKQASSLNWRRSNDAAPEGALKSSQKRFLILDQSGKQTRLLQFPLRFPSSVAAEPGKILDSLNPENKLSKDHAIPVKILLREDHVEKCYNGGEESEMHEDTEEIDALLYSDDEDNDDCDSDDEVMSTGHSPFLAEQQACDKTREELVETESSDDGPRCKRQKLLDHSYRDPSPSYVGTKSFTKLKGLSDDKLPESNISSKQETGSGLSEEQSRKDKMYIALRILESVVPGAKGKEALVLLDEAIDYLKLLKRNLNSSKDW